MRGREEDQGSERRKKQTGTRRRKGEYQEKVGSRNSREEDLKKERRNEN